MLPIPRSHSLAIVDNVLAYPLNIPSPLLTAPPSCGATVHGCYPRGYLRYHTTTPSATAHRVMIYLNAKCYHRGVLSSVLHDNVSHVIRPRRETPTTTFVYHILYIIHVIISRHEENPTYMCMEGWKYQFNVKNTSSSLSC